MSSFTVQYPGGYFDGDSFVITRYAKVGRIAVMRLKLGDGTKIMKVILPKVIPEAMRIKLKKCYEFIKWM